jgi:hypothetical protein
MRSDDTTLLSRNFGNCGSYFTLEDFELGYIGGGICLE